MPIVNMFFKSNKIPVKTEEPRLNQDLAIITQMNQEFATSLDLTDTLQNALEVRTATLGMVSRFEKLCRFCPI